MNAVIDAWGSSTHFLPVAELCTIASSQMHAVALHEMLCAAISIIF